MWVEWWNRKRALQARTRPLGEVVAAVSASIQTSIRLRVPLRTKSAPTVHLYDS